MDGQHLESETIVTGCLRGDANAAVVKPAEQSASIIHCCQAAAAGCSQASPTDTHPTAIAPTPAGSRISQAALHLGFSVLAFLGRATISSAATSEAFSSSSAILPGALLDEAEGLAELSPARPTPLCFNDHVSSSAPDATAEARSTALQTAHEINAQIGVKRTLVKKRNRQKVNSPISRVPSFLWTFLDRGLSAETVPSMRRAPSRLASMRVACEIAG